METILARKFLNVAPATLTRVQGRDLTVILIASGKYWLLEIFQLLCDQLWCLLGLWDLLTQARGENFNPYPEHMVLWAWPVKE